MPYAQAHYPFDKTKFSPKRFFKSKGYPADFIAEGLDQTRGWFYSMIVLGVSLFGKAPYKNVVVNGLVLAEDGTKMSKSKGNFPPLAETMEKYGADALRYFLASSPSVRAEDIRFSEKSVDEVSKKLLQRLDNVLAFYDLYSKVDLSIEKIESKNILDEWLIARLNETTKIVTESLEKYEIDRAARPILDFVDDLSNWYIRRSRDRFKSDDADKKDALNSTRRVLCELSKLMAPFTPFYAEYLFGKTCLRRQAKNNDDKESVHIEDWPEVGNFDIKIIENMKETRRLASLGLEQRAKIGLKVRQPLKSATVKIKNTIGEKFQSLLKDELNVKEILFADIQNEIEIDGNLTTELRQEGMARELIRSIQDLRKEAKLSVDDKAILSIDSDEKAKEFVSLIHEELKKTANIIEIKYENIPQAEILKIDEYSFKLKISKK